MGVVYPYILISAKSHTIFGKRVNTLIMDHNMVWVVDCEGPATNYTPWTMWQITKFVSRSVPLPLGCPLPLSFFPFPLLLPFPLGLPLPLLIAPMAIKTLASRVQRFFHRANPSIASITFLLVGANFFGTQPKMFLQLWRRFHQHCRLHCLVHLLARDSLELAHHPLSL